MRIWPTRVVVFGFVLALSGPAPAAGTDGMAAGEIEALQRRLVDAKCYAGPVDGAASAALDGAIAACPSQAPQLRVETGMHVVSIRRIGVDAACRLAATGSEDKTVRVWSLPEGRLLRTLRVPIGPGDEGKVNAVAMSADGRWIAAGGWSGQFKRPHEHFVTIFDAASGAVARRVGGFGNVILHLASSPDRRWLAATSAAKVGVKVIDTSTWLVVAADPEYAGDSYGAAFGPDGRLFTVAFDGKLRRYGPGPSFRLERQVATRGGKRPYSVAVDPRGKLVAVGFADSTKVDLYDTATLGFRAAADTRVVDNGSLISVAWRSDGARFVAGGNFNNSGDFSLLTFDRAGNRVGAPLPVAGSTIQNLQPCGGDFAMAAGDPAFGLVDGAGHRMLWRHGVAPDVRNMGEGFALSDDAQQVRFGLRPFAKDAVRFNLRTATLEDAPGAIAGLAPPRSGPPVADWHSTNTPTFAGKPITLEQYETSFSLALRSDNDGFVLGTVFWLRAFGTEGKPRWRQRIPGVAWGVNLSGDGRIVVVAYGDGTVRWHRWSDGQELLALFVNRDTKAWVAWTPSGYYMASPGGEDLIGWHLNRGWGQAADFFPASRFRDKFFRADVVKLVLDTLDEAKAVEQANAAGKRRADPKTIIERLPPVLTVVSPQQGSAVAPGTAEIRYTVRSPSGVKVDRIEVFVDGAKLGARGLARVEAAARADAATQGSAAVPMPAHDTVIDLVAYADELAGDPVRLQLKGIAPPVQAAASFPQEAGTADALKPSVYALLVGVSHYDNKALDLAFAADDANGLGAALMAQKGRLYKDVQVRVLTDHQASATAFKEGLQWLQEQTTSRDLAIVFAAGHGITDPKGAFWFMTTDGNERKLTTTAVSRNDITAVLYDLPGKKLLLLDACHSGAAFATGARGLARMDMSSAVNDFATAEGGVVAYAASTGSELSFEQPEWGHGAFTKALIEAIGEGKADLLRNGTITTATLDAFVADRVKQLTGGRQHAVMTRPKTVPDFPLALTR